MRLRALPEPCGSGFQPAIRRRVAARIASVVALVVALGSMILAAQTARWQPASEHPQVVREEIERILADRSYNRNYSKDTFGSLVEKVNAWLRDAIIRFLSGADERAAAIGRTLSLALAGTVVLAFAGLVYVLIRRHLRGRVRRQESISAGVRSFDLPVSGPLIAEARTLAEAGNYREAFRLAYMASIAWLDETRVLRFDKSKTNWEYVRDLEDGGLDAAVGQLRPLTLRFDEVIYGNNDSRRVDYDDTVRTFESLVAQAGHK